MAPESSPIDMYPSELLSLICAHVYAAGNSPTSTSLDPLLQSEGVPAALPSTHPPAYWLGTVPQQTLANLCLVNRAWYDAARPWLWRKIEVRLPRSWLSLVEEIAGGDIDHEGEDQTDQDQAAVIVDDALQEVKAAVFAARDTLGRDVDKLAALKLHEKVVERLSGPDGSIPPELLTPLSSRDPSPRRLRPKSKSPGRWRLMRSISDAVRIVMERDSPGLYVPSLEVRHVGHLVRHLDFNYFRTIGMRRSVEEGMNNRFVTGARLESVLKEMPNLLAFGATEYMDSALTSSVLSELFMRGSASRGRGRLSRGRDLVPFSAHESEEDDRDRRRECKELEALDLTGCVSAVFMHALTQFVTDRLIDRSDLESTPSEDDQRRERSRSETPGTTREPLTFPSMQRLGLRGVKSIQPHILHSFVVACPSLTHLDLSCTRVTPDLLATLGTSLTVHLHSLALERCNWLTGESIRSFLVDAPAARDIQQLSLYGDWKYPSPLSGDDLHDILARAPCFKTGRLVYLDISSSPLTAGLLRDVFTPQPRLRSLGLSHMPHLDMSAIADFLKSKAPNVEVLTMVATSPELGYGTHAVPVRKATLDFHARLVWPLCTPPFSVRSLSEKQTAEPPTRLRVIELSMSLLTSLGPGAGSWRVIKSKGGRGWYVDTASGWTTEPSFSGRSSSILKRDLLSDHPWRVALGRLADANGNVSSSIGWHARKMEVLHGNGLLGREAGLYGAVSFAYQG